MNQVEAFAQALLKELQETIDWRARDKTPYSTKTAESYSKGLEWGVRTALDITKKALRNYKADGLEDTPNDNPDNLNFAAWLNNRIAEAEHNNLPQEYINALLDIQKVYVEQNPLMGLVR